MPMFCGRHLSVCVKILLMCLLALGGAGGALLLWPHLRLLRLLLLSEWHELCALFVQPQSSSVWSSLAVAINP